MTRRVAFVAAAISLALALAACGSSGSSKPAEPPNPPPVDMRGQKAVAVNAQNNAFSPQSVIVSPGTRVTWTNRDQVAHNVKKLSDTANFGGAKFGVDVADFGPGKTYSYTFVKPGPYVYTCTIHGLMTGSVVVDASTNATTPST